MIKRYLPEVKTETVKNVNWNVLWISMAMGLLLALFQRAQIQPLSWFTSPQAIEKTFKEDVFQAVVIDKLTHVPSSFSLKRQNSFLIAPAQAQADDVVPIPSYIAIDFQTGDVILEKNSEEVRKIASLTKIMTAVVALDLASPDEKFTISEHAASRIPTKIGVIPGQQMTLKELLHATMLTSANDAAEVIKEGIDAKYGEEVFLRAMNEKARFLGLQASTFDNPQGFDGRQNYSSAYDLAILSHYAMNNYPLFREVVKKDYTFLAENSDHKQFDLINWNGLIGVYPNVYGIKIGYTENAGRTTVVAAERNGKHVLVVLLGAQDTTDRDYFAASLLDRAFEKAYGFEPVGITVDDLNAKYDSWNQYY